jgi:hypothetical protein
MFSSGQMFLRRNKQPWHLDYNWIRGCQKQELFFESGIMFKVAKEKVLQGKKLNGVDEMFGKLLKGDEANRKVKRGREEEFAMQIGLLRRVTSRSCMRNTSAPCVAFGADRALVKLAG